MSNPTVEQELLMLANSNGGVLKPDAVVEFAQNSSTALHSQFEWDNVEASHQHRLWQARKLIKVCVTQLDSGEENVPLFVSLREDRIMPGGGYRLLQAVLDDDEQRAALLRTAKADFEAFAARWRQLSELAELFSVGREVFKEV